MLSFKPKDDNCETVNLLRTNLRSCFSLHTYTILILVAESLGQSFMNMRRANENSARISGLPYFRLILGHNSKVSAGKKLLDDYNILRYLR